jgi:hypothetical protein
MKTRLLATLACLGLFAPQAAAQPTFVACAAAVAASTGPDVTVTLGSHQTDDILVMIVLVRDVDDSITVSGWTALTGTPFDRSTIERYWVFWKRATSGAETNPLVDKSTATGDTYASVCNYRSAIASGSPWDVIGATATGTSDPASCTAVTTTVANTLVIAILAYADDNNAAITTTGTDPAAYTEHYGESNLGADGSVSLSEGVRATAGGTGTVSVNFDVAVTAGDGWGCVVAALTPAPPPAGNMKSLPLTGVGLPTSRRRGPRR